MLKHLFLISALYFPLASWAACAKQQVGKEIFVDCIAEDLVVNNRVTSGITAPLPLNAAVMAAPSGQVRLPATFEAGGGQWRSTNEDVTGKANILPSPSRKPTASKVTKKRINKKIITKE